MAINFHLLENGHTEMELELQKMLLGFSGLEVQEGRL